MPVDAFDADVLIYAASDDHPLGPPVRALFEPVEQPARPGVGVGVGSVLLIPELLAKPLRHSAEAEVARLAALLSRLALVAADRSTAELAAVVGAKYGLGATDAVHLATAIGVGADRFLTNNSRDFSRSIDEIDIVYPADLDR